MVLFLFQEDQRGAFRVLVHGDQRTDLVEERGISQSLSAKFSLPLDQLTISAFLSVRYLYRPIELHHPERQCRLKLSLLGPRPRL
jgi:hypothetical protein